MPKPKLYRTVGKVWLLFRHGAAWEVSHKTAWHPLRIFRSRRSALDWIWWNREKP